mgnify:CR=1 FL=1
MTEKLLKIRARCVELLAIDQQAAAHHVRALHVQVFGKDERDAGIAHCHRDPLPGGDLAPEGQQPDHHHEGGVEEQNQPFHRHRHVLQAPEVEQAGEVVAEHAQHQHLPPLPAAQRGAVAAQVFAQA